MNVRPRSDLMLKNGLPLIADSKTHVVILGAFPGEESLAKRQYYANPRNGFWRLIGTALDMDFLSNSYSERLTMLLRHRIGLWDVFSACERTGSLDQAITCERLNDFRELESACPQLRRICFNGTKAFKYAYRFEESGVQVFRLPSSSSANARVTFREKASAWQQCIRGAATAINPE
jgi:hypoxanthine-DNA glycosylase